MGEWISIYGTGDSVQASLFSQILEEQGISCIIRNQDVQNLFGVGTLGAGFNPVTGPIELVVEKEFAERAVGILRDVEEDARKREPQQPARGPFEGDDLRQQMARGLAWCLLFGAVVSSFGGVGGSLTVLAVGLAFLIPGLFGFLYQIHLRRLGYEWATLMDANWMLLRLEWKKAYRLPPAEEVETLPEVGAGDPDSVIAFVKRLQQYRRTAKKARKTKASNRATPTE